MNFSPPQANTLCQNVVDGLASWPAFAAAVQTAGVEQKARGPLGEAITKTISGIPEACAYSTETHRPIRSYTRHLFRRDTNH